MQWREECSGGGEQRRWFLFFLFAREEERVLSFSFFSPESLDQSTRSLLSSYAIVTLQATGHFTGAPYRAVAHPEWPSLTPTGKRFALAPETVKVKVNKRGKIEEIAIVPVPGGGPRGLYEALGGKMPPSK